MFLQYKSGTRNPADQRSAHYAEYRVKHWVRLLAKLKPPTQWLCVIASVVIAVLFLFVINSNAEYSELTKKMLDQLVMPLFYMGDPSKRIFWLYLFIAAVFSLFFVFVHHRRRLVRKPDTPLSTPNYRNQLFIELKHFTSWMFHREAGYDFSLMLSNSILKGLFILPIIGSQLALILGFSKALQTQFGNAPNLHLPYWSVIILFTFAFFLSEDGSRFWLHKQMHQRRWLWRFHKTHHSASTLTPLTLFRVHPVEMLLYYLRATLVLTVVAGTFVYLFKGKVGGLEILGVDALGFIFNSMLSNLRHSHLHVGFGKWEKLFISPAQHQLHHSCNPLHFNRNYGSSLSCWDRLCGSFSRSSIEDRDRERPWATALKFGVR